MIWHISDLHLEDSPEENGRVEGKLRELYRLMGPRDILAVTGDITEDGSKGQYEEAHRVLSPWGGRLVLAPGNHDYGPWGNLYNPAAWFRYKTLVDRLAVTSSAGTFRFLSIDSCLHTFFPFDFAAGYVGYWRRRRIRIFGDFCRRYGFISLVCLHHNPFYKKVGLELLDKKRFLKTVSGRIDYVLYGHSHTRIKHEDSGTQYLSARKFDRITDIRECLVV